MFLLKSDDQYFIESISYVLEQKKFFHTLDINKKHFFSLNFNFYLIFTKFLKIEF